ncbi:hypothetical protein EYF80_042174 [Liparis tanakae]|uniref:Uncharacterized protein n=1 Tax=Liparis tanakae TaxID=230148 RepID=A0A4Z2G413_9TELE|nr:hypothetical protein EYF80_042174 [Liparis tanakae]
MANSANATGGPTSLPADLEMLRAMLLSDLKSTIQEALAPLADSINKLHETTEDHGRRVTGIEEDLSGYRYTNRLTAGVRLKTKDPDREESFVAVRCPVPPFPIRFIKRPFIFALCL